jgi:ABC-type multidrug transport system fused ATPase/permease subunit
MFGLVSGLTGGAISKVVAQSSKKESELPVAKPIDALEQFNEEHGKAISSFESFKAFEAKFNASKSNNNGGKLDKKLVSILWSTFWKDVLKAAFLKAMWGGFVIFSVAFFVFRLLAYIRNKSTDVDHTRQEKEESYYLAAFFFVSMFVLSVSLQQMSFVSSTLGQKVKAALVTAIFRKMLVREGYQSDADVVSLVAKDCPKIAEACTSLQFLWSGIFEAFGIFGVLFAYIGLSALPGLGWLLVALPLQYGLGLWLASKKSMLAKNSKKRIKLMEEILRGIKLIKTYGWESYFKEIIEKYRKEEASSLDFIHVIKSLIFANVFACPPLFCILIFGTYEAVGEFDATISFTTLTFFNTLRLPLVKLPKGLRDVLDARLALDRIESFLLESELANNQKPNHASREDLVVVPGGATQLKDFASTGRDYPAGGGVQITNADFSYGADAQALLLGINLSLPAGSLLMVAGPVASGKTNLLRAVLGQVTCKSGVRNVQGSLSYVPQVPWTALGTVRDNIIFGLPFDETHYRRVVWACALETDLTLMAAGDQTYIGERGGNLSGGQKQRIALARAAYSQADVNVLDSPLSAVDMHTCQHIFKYCIQDMMLARGATVVLATHQTELFPHASSLAVMGGGRILYSGGCVLPPPHPAVNLCLCSHC